MFNSYTQGDEEIYVLKTLHLSASLKDKVKDKTNVLKD